MLALLACDDDLVAKAAVKPLDRDRDKVANARDAIQRIVGEFFAHLSLHLATKARGIQKAEEDDPIVATAEAADYESLGKAVQPHLREVAKDAAALGLEQVSASTHTSLTQANERAVRWAEQRAAELVTQVEETTRDGIRALVARALDEGWTNDELAQELLDSGVFAASRAETIARTEVAAADVQGNLIGWQESGVVSGKEWKTGGGPCDACDELDGTAVALDDDFPDGDPPLHPNCRCDVLPVLADEE